MTIQLKSCYNSLQAWYLIRQDSPSKIKLSRKIITVLSLKVPIEHWTPHITFYENNWYTYYISTLFSIYFKRRWMGFEHREMPVSMLNILFFSISSLKHYINFFYSFINHTASFTAIYHIHIQTQQRGPTVLNEQNIYFNSNKSKEEN